MLAIYSSQTGFLFTSSPFSSSLLCCVNHHYHRVAAKRNIQWDSRQTKGGKPLICDRWPVVYWMEKPKQDDTANKHTNGIWTQRKQPSHRHTYTMRTQRATPNTISCVDAFCLYGAKGNRLLRMFIT